jgi:hypothetical protein
VVAALLEVAPQQAMVQRVGFLLLLARLLQKALLVLALTH